MPSISDALLDFLRADESGEERYAFDELAAEALEAILDAIFADPISAPAAIDELLKLASALELELGSPAAAALIKRTLSADRRVVELLRAGERDDAKAALWGGQVQVKNAPAINARAPAGTVKAASLIDPLRPPRAVKRPSCAVR